MILYINGTDRTEYLLKESLYLKKSIGNVSDVCDFVLHDTTSSFQIYENDYVVVEESSSNIFAGYVINSIGTKVGVGASGSVTWSVTCKDVSIITDKITFDVSYVGQSDQTIVSALINGYFSLSSDVNWVENDIDIEFRNETMRECLNKVAQQTSSIWFIDADEQLHWRDSTSISFSSKIVNSQNWDEVTAFPPLKNSRNQRDASNIINRVKIYGGLSANATRTTETFTFNSGTFSYQLTNYPIQSIRGISYYVSGQLTYSFGSSISAFGHGEGSLPITMHQETGGITFESVTPDNGTTVTVDYYYVTEIYYQAEDVASQGIFGLVERVIVDQTITAQTEAEAKAQSLLDEYAYPRETISVDVMTSGFTPGDVIYCYIPELNVNPTENNLLVLESGDYLLLENDNIFGLESVHKPIVRQIQEVSIRYSGANNQLFSTLTIGKTSYNLITTLASLQAFSSQLPSRSLPSKLSNYSPDMGVIQAGIGVFTDGGTATFSWDNYAAHSGVVLGLEDTGTNQYGIVSVLDTGTEKVRLGRLNDVPLIGTVQPSGWGIYTENGYFTGVVYGSTIEGGTVKGNLITGGTVTGALISGGTVTGNTIIGGTVATSTPPINSGNPGVYLDSTGLYGYGTAGLTFRLSSDPAIKPYFSSGTITEVIYEVSTNAVIRTGTTNPRVQIDNSGIFGYDSGGVLRFQFDTGTGYLQAVNGSFSGTVSSSLVSAGTVSGGTVTGALVTAGTVSGNQITGGTVTGSRISGGTVSGGLISGGTVSAGFISGGTVNGASLQGSVDVGNVSFVNTSQPGTPVIMTTSGDRAIFNNIDASTSDDSYLGIGHGFQQLMLRAPGGTVWGVTIDNSGVLQTTALFSDP